MKLSVSFLGGMHLFEYLLRDFIGTEKNSTKNSIILLHDCCSFDHTMTTRDLECIPRFAWTGDVLDCKPTGLVALPGSIANLPAPR